MTEQNRERDIRILNLPKNIRQMGKPGGIYRFYIEDYAYTYLNMFLKEHHQEDTLQAAVLLGKWEKEGDISYIFASGAAVCDFSVFYEDGEEQIDEVIQKFFPDSEIVGWYVRCSGRDSHVQSVVKHYYAEKSGTHHPVFVYEDEYEGEGEMHVCVWEQGALQKLSGYYIYYEKNPRMQEYMICQKNSYRSSDRVIAEEKTDKSSYNRFEVSQKVSEIEPQKNEKEEKIRTKHVERPSSKARKTVYAACAAVLITAAATGISQMDNYQSLRQTVQTLSGSLTGNQSESLDSNEENKSYDDKEEQQDEQSSNEITQTPQTTKEQTLDSQTTKEQVSEDKTSSQEELQEETQNQENKENEQNTETPNENSDDEEKQNTSDKYYIVRKGDSLFSISRSLYHTDDMVDELRNLNGLTREDVIYEGQKLRLP